MRLAVGLSREQRKEQRQRARALAAERADFERDCLPGMIGKTDEELLQDFYGLLPPSEHAKYLRWVRREEEQFLSKRSEEEQVSCLRAKGLTEDEALFLVWFRRDMKKLGRRRTPDGWQR